MNRYLYLLQQLTSFGMSGDITVTEPDAINTLVSNEKENELSNYVFLLR